MLSVNDFELDAISNHSKYHNKFFSLYKFFYIPIHVFFFCMSNKTNLHKSVEL